VKLWNAADQLELSLFEKKATGLVLEKGLGRRDFLEEGSLSGLSFRICRLESSLGFWYVLIVGGSPGQGNPGWVEEELLDRQFPGKRAGNEAWKIVEAGVEDAPVMAEFWARLMEEEAPPFFSVGTHGRRRAETAFGRMVTQRDFYRGYLALQGPELHASGFILGSVYDRLYGEPRRAGNILHWYVLPELRSQGMGEDLYRHLLAWFERERVEVLEVMARKEEARTRAWMARGFEGVLDLFMKKAPWAP